MDELWERFSNGELLNADSNKINNGKQYTTKSGKIVYGGGGIMPDVFVPIDTSSYDPRITRLLLDGRFSSFVYEFYLSHRQALDAFANADQYVRGFASGDQMWNDFVNFSAKEGIDLNKISAKDKASLQKRLKASLARFKWRNNGFYQVMNSDDAVVTKAIEVLGK